MNGWLTVMWIP
jgi:hypothetical protein